MTPALLLCLLLGLDRSKDVSSSFPPAWAIWWPGDDPATAAPLVTGLTDEACVAALDRWVQGLDENSLDRAVGVYRITRLRGPTPPGRRAEIRPWRRAVLIRAYDPIHGELLSGTLSMPPRGPRL
jgi:hypothetical protein